MILSLNLNVAMKRLAWGESLENRPIKAIRLRLINLPGRVSKHARGLVVRLVGGHPSNDLLLEERRADTDPMGIGLIAAHCAECATLERVETSPGG